MSAPVSAMDVMLVNRELAPGFRVVRVEESHDQKLQVVFYDVAVRGIMPPERYAGDHSVRVAIADRTCRYSSPQDLARIVSHEAAAELDKTLKQRLGLADKPEPPTPEVQDIRPEHGDLVYLLQKIPHITGGGVLCGKVVRRIGDPVDIVSNGILTRNRSIFRYYQVWIEPVREVLARTQVWVRAGGMLDPVIGLKTAWYAFDRTGGGFKEL